MELIAAIIVIMLMGSVFLGIGIYHFYLEFTIQSNGYHTRGIVTHLSGGWNKSIDVRTYGRPRYSSYVFKPVVKFNDPSGKTLTKRLETGIHSTILLPSEGDRVEVIYYDGKIYATTFKRILIALASSAVGIIFLTFMCMLFR
jgi:hypothetical protein